MAVLNIVKRQRVRLPVALFEKIANIHLLIDKISTTRSQKTVAPSEQRKAVIQYSTEGILMNPRMIYSDNTYFLRSLQNQ